MNRRESTRIAVARRRDAARVARSTDRRARPPRVAARFARRRARASRAVARAVARCGLLLLSLRLHIRYIQRIMRTQSTITKWITRVIVCVNCVSTPVCPNSPPPPRRGVVASARVDARDDAMRAMRCVRARFARDSRRARARAAPPERRPSRDDRASIASRGRGADRAMDSRRRRRSSTTSRRRRVSPRTRFEDSTSRARAARARGRRDARARRRATEEGSRARGARGRARDDEGRRGEKK